MKKIIVFIISTIFLCGNIIFYDKNIVIYNSYKILLFKTVALNCNPFWKRYPKKLHQLACQVYFFCEENKIPIEDIILLTKIESDFFPNAKSKKGALGITQVMTNTGVIICAQLRIKFDKNKLQRDPIYNSQIGIRHYSNIKRIYKNRNKAITAYNFGTYKNRYRTYFKKIDRHEQEIREIVNIFD